MTKEFFHLIVQKLFDPDYGMFTLNEENMTYWFNIASMENIANYQLIGLVSFLETIIYENYLQLFYVLCFMFFFLFFVFCFFLTERPKILGLAIYNGVILDIHFPPVIYKQLLRGGKTDLNLV